MQMVQVHVMPCWALFQLRGVTQARSPKSTHTSQQRTHSLVYVMACVQMHRRCCRRASAAQCPW
jgi:hypothetical protein